MDTMISIMKSYINSQANSSFNTDTSLSINNLKYLLEETNSIESEIKKDFKEKLLRLAEAREKLNILIDKNCKISIHKEEKRSDCSKEVAPALTEIMGNKKINRKRPPLQSICNRNSKRSSSAIVTGILFVIIVIYFN
jgi:hypothetical protein